MEVKDVEKSNTLAKLMKEIEKEEEPMPNTISKNEVNQNSTLNNLTIINLNNEIKESNSPFLYKNKIP